MIGETDAACGYVERGWSVLPMRMAEKRPVARWKRYQREPASNATVYRWFRQTDHGVGVIFGHVSDGLASRDFDDADAYHRWADQQPALASTLPTVATRRGFHVYCRAWPQSVQEACRLLVSKGTTGTINLGDGELRAGVGCYSVLKARKSRRMVLDRPEVFAKGVLDDLPTEDVRFVELAFRGDAIEGGTPRDLGRPVMTIWRATARRCCHATSAVYLEGRDGGRVSRSKRLYFSALASQFKF